MSCLTNPLFRSTRQHQQCTTNSILSNTGRPASCVYVYVLLAYKDDTGTSYSSVHSTMSSLRDKLLANESDGNEFLSAPQTFNTSHPEYNGGVPATSVRTLR